MITTVLLLTGLAFGEVSYEETAIFQPAPLIWVNFGKGICFADADGDGALDMFVSSGFFNNGKGAGWVFRGPKFETHKLFTVPGLIPEGPGTNGDQFGSGTWEAADLNGDGYADLFASASGPGEFGFSHGRAFVLWGPEYDTHLELQHPGITNGVDFGHWGDIADVTGDGALDLLVGVPLYGDLTKKGRIDVFDGATGFVGPPIKVLEPVDHSIILNVNGWGFGAHGGDVTGDGVADVVTAQAVAGPGGSAFFLVILDGADPTRTIEIGPSSLGVNQMGRSFLFVDMNADGSRDLVCASRSGTTPAMEHRVTVLWGPTYKTGITRASSLPSGSDRFYEFDVGDVNRDGHMDLVVGSPGTDGLQSNGGRVTVLLGPDFQPGQHWDGPVHAGQRGMDVAVADIDGDGFDEFFVGAPFESYGVVRIFTHHTLRALTDPQVSVSVGGSVPLKLECGRLSKKDVYHLLVSVSGSAPGFDVPTPGGVVHVPLNVDLLTQIGLAYGNGPLFTAFHGQLDADGNALATLTIPAGLAGPSLIGLELTFAGVTLDDLGCVDYATRAVTVMLGP